MEFHRLRYFMEVARQKNFSKAASVCRVSQPSLSQQIKKLENEVGGELLIRSHGDVALSELGEKFLKHAQAILAEVEVAEDFVSEHQYNTQRTVGIAAIPTIAPYLIPPIFRNIQAVLPDVRFELREALTEDIEDLLLTGNITFALISPPTKVDFECDSLDLVEDEFVLALPVEHTLANEDSVSVEHLRGERLFLLEHSHCLARQTASYCDEIGVSANVDIVGSQIDTLLGMVENGFGLTFIPRIAVKAHSHRRVVFRSMKSHSCFRKIQMVWLKRKFLTRTQQTVIDAVKSQTF